MEQPLVVQDSDTRTAQSILSNLCRHPTTLTQAYLNLHNAFGEQVDPILGIFNSNSIPLAPVEPVPNPPGSILAYGVFLQLSRFNNSCSPNASITWDERKSQITVHALQPIPAGSEITVCYGQPLFATRSERRDYLQRTMGFRCTCSCCSLSDEASRASDARRTELWRLFKAVPFLGHDAAAGIRAVSRALMDNLPFFPFGLLFGRASGQASPSPVSLSLSLSHRHLTDGSHSYLCGAEGYSGTSNPPDRGPISISGFIRLRSISVLYVIEGCR